MAEIKCNTVGDAWDIAVEHVDLSLIGMAGPWYAFLAPAFSKTFNSQIGNL